MDQIEVFCPGSVANISCGFDVLGFCLEPVGDLMKVTKTDKPGITIGSIKGQDLPKDPLKMLQALRPWHYWKHTQVHLVFKLISIKELNQEVELVVALPVQQVLFLR